MIDKGVRKHAGELYSRFKDFENDSAVPQTIKQNIKALKAIAKGEEKEKVEEEEIRQDGEKGIKK